MTASQLYQSGQLQQAVASATQAVKERPTDATSRWLLCELLCFSGDLTRADLQLDAIGQQDMKLAVGVSQFRHLIRAEQARQQFYSEGRVPEFLDQPSEELKLRLEASIRVREGAVSEAAKLLEKAEELRRPLAGKCNGKAIGDFRDLDDLSASYLEVLTSNGKYYWVPLERVDRIEFTAPQRARDLIWRAASLAVQSGPDGQVYVPVIYPATSAQQEERLKLGRATEWQGGDGAPTRGLGQRTFLAGEEDLSIMQIETVEFTPARAG